jgi:hypothetical protein
MTSRARRATLILCPARRLRRCSSAFCAFSVHESGATPATATDASSKERRWRYPGAGGRGLTRPTGGLTVGSTSVPESLGPSSRDTGMAGQNVDAVVVEDGDADSDGNRVDQAIG